MPPINPFTGKKRKRSRHFTPRKKRETCASTVEERTLAKQAIQLCGEHLQVGATLIECANGIFQNFVALFPALCFGAVGAVILQCIAHLLDSAVDNLRGAYQCLLYDSYLLDLDDGVWESAGYRMPLNRNIRIDAMFQNDDMAGSMTRFTKGQLHYLVMEFDLDEFIHVPQDCDGGRGDFYVFHREELLIFMFCKITTRMTFWRLAEDPRFGGSECRWAKGYHWIIWYLDERYYHLIGPDGIENWVEHFPDFARSIWTYLQKPKTRHDGRQVSWDHQGAATVDQFNIFGFLDCKKYGCSRLGSGPANPFENAPRRPDAYFMQLACYDGHHKMHDIKILSLSLPNGMDAAVIGPVFGRHKDPSMLENSEIDDALHDLQQQQFPDRGLYCAYGDSTFRGFWHCIRTRHEALPTLGIVLTPPLENENDCLKSARESVEMGYSLPPRLFPAIDEKKSTKLGLDAEFVVAQVRVAHFLTNLNVCFRRGSTCTGDRMFAHPPPTLEEYLSGTPYANV